MGLDEVETHSWSAIKRILVELGSTPYTPIAIRRALELAQRHEAMVTGVTIVDFKGLRDSGVFYASGARVHDQEVQKERLRSTVEHLDEAVEGFKAACEEAGR